MKIIFVVNIHIFQILKSSTCVFKKNKTEPFFNDFLDRLALVNCAIQYYSANRKCSFSHSHKKNVLVIVFVCIQYKYLIGSSSPSSKSNVPGHWLFFCPAPKVGPYFGRPVTKSLDFPKWHWLILALMSANVYVHRMR